MADEVIEIGEGCGGCLLLWDAWSDGGCGEGKEKILGFFRKRESDRVLMGGVFDWVRRGCMVTVTVMVHDKVSVRTRLVACVFHSFLFWTLLGCARVHGITVGMRVMKQDVPSLSSPFGRSYGVRGCMEIRCRCDVLFLLSFFIFFFYFFSFSFLFVFFLFFLFFFLFFVIFKNN